MAFHTLMLRWDRTSQKLTCWFVLNHPAQQSVHQQDSSKAHALHQPWEALARNAGMSTYSAMAIHTLMLRWNWTSQNLTCCFVLDHRSQQSGHQQDSSMTHALLQPYGAVTCNAGTGPTTRPAMHP